MGDYDWIIVNGMTIEVYEFDNAMEIRIDGKPVDMSFTEAVKFAKENGSPRRSLFDDIFDRNNEGKCLPRRIEV